MTNYPPLTLVERLLHFLVPTRSDWRLPLLRVALVATVVTVAAHARHLGEPPGGFHKWRESDTAAVAENFWHGGFDAGAPEVNVVGSAGTTRVGTEMPVYTFATALLYEAFGFSHWWPRLLSLLGGLALGAAVVALARRLAPEAAKRAFAVAAGWLTLFCPLVFFYGGRIQPDIWGLAFATWGAAIFLGRRTPFSLAGAALCLALAGGIKPTFFFVGLPLCVALARDEGGLAKALRRPAVWGFAAFALAPAVLWLRHARQLSKDYGEVYFYLGQNWTDALRSLSDPQFYSHVLLTWPFELAIGLPFAPIFLFGLWRARTLPGKELLAAWVLGAFTVFALAAGHCATPHDYYYLPIVPALALVTAHGLTSLRRPWLLRTATVLVLLAPVNGYFRMWQRYEADPEFWELRAAVHRTVPDGELVIAIDKVPAYQLYRVGRQGYHVAPDAPLATIRDRYASGARYLVHAEVNGRLSAALRAYLAPEPMARAGTTTVYAIEPSIVEAGDLERLITER